MLRTLGNTDSNSKTFMPKAVSSLGITSNLVIILDCCWWPQMVANPLEHDRWKVSFSVLSPQACHHKPHSSEATANDAAAVWYANWTKIFIPIIIIIIIITVIIIAILTTFAYMITIIVIVHLVFFFFKEQVPFRSSDAGTAVFPFPCPSSSNSRGYHMNCLNGNSTRTLPFDPIGVALPEKGSIHSKR